MLKRYLFLINYYIYRLLARRGSSVENNCKIIHIKLQRWNSEFKKMRESYFLCILHFASRYLVTYNDIIQFWLPGLVLPCRMIGFHKEISYNQFFLLQLHCLSIDILCCKIPFYFFFLVKARKCNKNMTQPSWTDWLNTICPLSQCGSLWARS